jgi:perosamine synthetase
MRSLCRVKNMEVMNKCDSAANPSTGMQTESRMQIPQLPGVIGTFMGRDALALALSTLKLGPQDTVLLPAYTCQEVLKSFATRVNIEFYDVCADLTIDPDEIRPRLQRKKVGMLLITDYFGFLQPARQELRKLCDEYGASLIEDCAHSLLTEGAGEAGDYAIFSLRKLLQVPDGGGLKVNKRDTSLTPAFYPSLYSNALSLTAIIKSGLNIHSEMLSRARVASKTQSLVPTVTGSNGKERTLPLSYFTRAVMMKQSFDEVIRKRREDFVFWRECCAINRSLSPLFTDLPAHVCPFGFPVFVEKRTALEDRVRRSGISLSVHWRLDRTLAPECSVSQDLSTRMLTLPLFPHLADKQREVLAKLLSEESLHRG